MWYTERYFYDTEFFERGPEYPIEMISIGIKTQVSSQRYYAISSNFDFAAAWNHRAWGKYWLRENVLEQLPLIRRGEGVTPSLDLDHPLVRPLDQIRQELQDFFRLKKRENHPVKRELWAWYSDYDHVVLSQIWGAMINLPKGMPMFTHDLKQIIDLAGNPAMPAQVTAQHNALTDAEHVEVMWNHCRDLGLPVIQQPR